MLAVVLVLAVLVVSVLVVLGVLLRRVGTLTAAAPVGQLDASGGPTIGPGPAVVAPGAGSEDRRADAELAAHRTVVEQEIARRRAAADEDLTARRAAFDATSADRAAAAEETLAARLAGAERRSAERIAAAESALNARLAHADVESAARLDAAERTAAQLLAAAQDELAEARAHLAADRSALEGERIRLAGISPAEARAEVLASVLADAHREAALQLRRVEADATEHAEARAREIVSQAVQRVATPTTAEVAVATVRLPGEDYKGRIIGREGRNIRAFETVTGVDVIIDDTPEVVALSCFDPVRREVARLTMAALVEDGRIHPQRIEDTYAASLAEVDAVCRRAAEDALLAVGIGDLHEVLVRHLGALRFRTSYGQNVLAHLVESAAIARTMAAEVGADVELVTRCAFLHDIGKALTHEIPGSHALVGAELARSCGESEAVVHAIEAHHDEVTPRTVEAVLTQASDACSGGRPGARRESAAAYTERLARIEAIASAQPGVQRVFAVQAGHEVRVLVSPDEVDDLAAAQIARVVAKQIEQELTYPGQVRVTVIRESRVSEVAH